MNKSNPYQAPVDQLLQEIEFTPYREEWPNYLELYGLTTADIPELKRLSLDKEPATCQNYEWMIHGLRAVAQLDPIASIDLYLQQLRIFIDDDFLRDEADAISRKAGKQAIEPFTHFLKNTAENEWARVSIADGLEEIAKADPDSRAACVQVMMDQLRMYKLPENEILNSTLVDNLAQLKAVEAANLIEEVFAHGDLDEWRTGSWPAVQVRLGLKSESDFSPEELKATPPPNILAIREALDLLQTATPPFKAVQQSAKYKQQPLDFSNQAALKPKSAGFGSAQSRPKKNKQKKR